MANLGLLSRTHRQRQEGTLRYRFRNWRVAAHFERSLSQLLHGTQQARAATMRAALRRPGVRG